MIELVLKPGMLPIRDAEKGLVRVRGHVCRGIGVSTHEITDSVALYEAERSWMAEDWDARGPRPEAINRTGFRLSHEGSGLLMTPSNWLLPDIDAVKTCLRSIFAKVPGDLFERPAESIRRLGPIVLEAHRKAGVWRANAAHLERLDRLIDEQAWRTRLDELKAAPSCEEWREQGVLGWGAVRSSSGAKDEEERRENAA